MPRLALVVCLPLLALGCSSSPTAPLATEGAASPQAVAEPWGLPQAWVDQVVFTWLDGLTPRRKVLERFADGVELSISGPASHELRAAAAQVSAVTGREIRFVGEGGTVRIVTGRRLASGAWAIYCHRYNAPAYTAADLVLGDGGATAMRADVHEFGHALGLEHSDREGLDVMAANGPRAFSAYELRALEVMYRHRQPGDPQ